MIAGHFGLAAGVKAHERSVPLWALMLATVWLDVVFIPLLLAGVERIDPIGRGGYGAVIIHAEYTHSLLGAAILAVVFGLASAYRWGRRAGSVLGAVAFSHWLLDLVVHRGDLPILPGAAGNLPRLGLGLWQYPWGSIAVELALVVVGSALYWRAAVRQGQATDTLPALRPHLAGALALVAGIGVLGLDAFAG